MRQLNLKKEIALNGLKRGNALAVKIALTSTLLKDVEYEKEKAREKVKTVVETDPSLGADLLLLERAAGKEAVPAFSKLRTLCRQRDAGEHLGGRRTELHNLIRDIPQRFRKALFSLLHT